jgi:hypothetical protein
MKEGCTPNVNVNEIRENRSEGLNFEWALQASRDTEKVQIYTKTRTQSKTVWWSDIPNNQITINEL